MINMTVGFNSDALCRRRRVKKMSQDDLALQLGVTRQAVSKWERGVASPEADNIPYLAVALGCSTDDLFIFPPGVDSTGNAA